MRVLALDLVAFGHFEGRTLALCPPGGERPGFTVVYGRNEAGKSTSLRALEALFFGFEHHTPDAHRHPSKKLRVGGVLASDAGALLRCVRRTGLRDTLRDEAERPLPESAMRALLRGVDREVYRTLYGLDHRRLREGARALLSERSSLAESLFEAGVTGAGVAKLVTSLRAEAEALFTPRSRDRPLNKALRGYADAKHKGRSFATPHEAYVQQLAGIEEQAARRSEAELALRRLERERRRVERGRRVAPLLVRRRDLAERLAALGPVPQLAAGARGLRERAQADLAAATRLAELCAEQLREVEAELASLPAPALEPTEALATLSELVGAVRDGIARRASLEREREELATLAQPGEAAEPIDAAVEASTRRLLLARGEARARAAELGRVASERAAVLSAERARLASGGADEAASGLDALALAQKRGELAVSRELERPALCALRVEAEALAEARRASLGTPLALDDLASRAAPAEEELDEIGRALDAVVARLAACARRGAELGRARASRRAEEVALLARGEPATEEGLAAARARRDDALAAGAPLAEVVPLVAAADRDADRLREDAERAARLREVRAALAALDQELEQLGAEQAALELERAEVERSAGARMVAAGAPALGPAQAKHWLGRRRLALEAHAATKALEARIEALDADVAHGRAALVGALRGARGDEPLSVLFAQLGAELRAAGARRAEGEALRARIGEQELELARARVHAEEAREAAHQAESRAEAALAALGLPASAEVEDVVSLAAASRLSASVSSKLAANERELARIAAAETKLTAYVVAVSAELGHGPGAPQPAVSSLARGEALLEELRATQRTRERRRELEQRAIELAGRRGEARDASREAEATLEGLRLRAGATDVAALAEIEERSAAAQALARELEATLGQIAAASDDAPLAELEAELHGFDAAAEDADLDRLDDERQELERTKEQAGHARAGLEQALREMETQDSRAAQYMDLANLELARAKSLAQRWARLRLAGTLLEHQIEAYRARHQGPLLARTEELFRALTGGSFDGLRVVLDARDRPELVCLRDGAEVDLDGLSDGAKDQLFLALRLATVERHNKGAGESLPLVLDDVLIHFDEERAKSALELFSSLDGAMQVLMFTHQERLAEIARALGPGRAHVVEL